jgi:hypothetical protein
MSMRFVSLARQVYLWTHSKYLEDSLYKAAGFHLVERVQHRGALAAVMAAQVGVRE